MALLVDHPDALDVGGDGAQPGAGLDGGNRVCLLPLVERRAGRGRAVAGAGAASDLRSIFSVSRTKKVSPTVHSPSIRPLAIATQHRRRRGSVIERQVQGTATGVRMGDGSLFDFVEEIAAHEAEVEVV